MLDQAVAQAKNQVLTENTTLTIIDRTCPLCSSSVATAEVAARHPAESLPSSDLANSWFGFFKEKSFFTFSRCQKCGLLYCPRFFSDSTLAHLYGSMPDNTAGLDESLLKKTQYAYFRFLKKFSDLKGSFLEFGPDIGLFTKHVAETKEVDSLWLFEPNRNVHARLSGLSNSKAIEIRTDLFDLSPVPDASIANVVLIHVLDHMSDPRAMLESLGKKMKPGAKILVVTHSERSFLARVLGHRWPAYCLQHPQLFNRQTTKELFATCGFKVLKTAPSVNYFPLTYLLKHLLFAIGLKSVPLPQWEWLAGPLYLGNIMTVAQFEGSSRDQI